MKIKDTSKIYPKINDTSKKYPKVDPKKVADALGAEIVGPSPKGHGTGNYFAYKLMTAVQTKNKEGLGGNSNLGLENAAQSAIELRCLFQELGVKIEEIREDDFYNAHHESEYKNKTLQAELDVNAVHAAYDLASIIILAPRVYNFQRGVRDLQMGIEEVSEKLRKHGK